MVALFDAATNQSMVLLFDATVTFDDNSMLRVVAHLNAAHPDVTRPDVAYRIDWN